MTFSTGCAPFVFFVMLAAAAGAEPIFCTGGANMELTALTLPKRSPAPRPPKPAPEPAPKTSLQRKAPQRKSAAPSHPAPSHAAPAVSADLESELSNAMGAEAAARPQRPAVDAQALLEQARALNRRVDNLQHNLDSVNTEATQTRQRPSDSGVDGIAILGGLLQHAGSSHERPMGHPSQPTQPTRTPMQHTYPSSDYTPR